MPDAVLFDMGGLVLDTERIGREGRYAATRLLGIPLPKSVIAASKTGGLSASRSVCEGDMI